MDLSGGEFLGQNDGTGGADDPALVPVPVGVVVDAAVNGHGSLCLEVEGRVPGVGPIAAVHGEGL